MDLNGTSALVTGAGSGLGEAAARALAEKGAKVAVVDLNEDAAARVARDIGGLHCALDVQDEDAVRTALDLIKASHGVARIVVNCAGIGTPGRIVERDGPLPLDDFRRVIGVNLVGTFNIMRLAALAMSSEAEGTAGGVIINTASVAAYEGQIGQAAYAASKGGIVALTLPAARELARFGIRVNVIAPGIFETPLLLTLPEEARISLAANIPCPPRLGTPAEFAAAVLFCVENDYINAETIRLDGGARLAAK